MKQAAAQKTPEDRRRAELGKIHLLAKQLGLEEFDRRQMYRAQTGKDSAAAMTPAERGRVLAHLSRAAGVKTRADTSRERLGRKIEAIKADLNLTDAYLDEVARRITGIDSWKWCNAGQKRKLVAALTYHQRRKRKEAQ
jgi:phage gp16-like protein